MSWKRVTSSAEVLPVHAAFMGSGKILHFGGDEFDPEHNLHDDFHHAARLFDCNNSTVREVPSPNFDAFCCGHAFLGKAIDKAQLVAAGGTEQWRLAQRQEELFHHGHFSGLKDAAVFPRRATPTPAVPAGSGRKQRT
jgi:hypothetical protein